MRGRALARAPALPLPLPLVQAWRPSVTVAAPTYESDYLEEYIPSDSFAGAKPHRQFNSYHQEYPLAT